MKMTIYTNVNIKLHSSGFELYERGELDLNPESCFSDFSDIEDKLNDCGYVEISKALKDPEFIKSGVEDIRGNIYNESGWIFAKIDSKPDFCGNWVPKIVYTGVESVNVHVDFFKKKLDSCIY